MLTGNRPINHCGDVGNNGLSDSIWDQTISASSRSPDRPLRRQRPHALAHYPPTSSACRGFPSAERGAPLTIPCSSARRTASRRVVAPSFSRILWT